MSDTTCFAATPPLLLVAWLGPERLGGGKLRLGLGDESDESDRRVSAHHFGRIGRIGRFGRFVPGPSEVWA